MDREFETTHLVDGIVRKGLISFQESFGNYTIAIVDRENLSMLTSDWNCSGIYVLFRVGTNLMYVGMADDGSLRKRQFDHANKKGRVWWDRSVLVKRERLDPRFIKRAEKQLIRDLKNAGALLDNERSLDGEIDRKRYEKQLDHLSAITQSALLLAGARLGTAASRADEDPRPERKITTASAPHKAPGGRVRPGSEWRTGILRLLSEHGVLTTTELYDLLDEYLKLSEPEKQRMVKSGAEPKWTNEVRNTIKDLKSNGLVTSPGHGQYEIVEN